MAQIRQGRKCAATCQRQTGMFSDDFWMWPRISQLTAARVAENSAQRDHYMAKLRSTYISHKHVYCRHLKNLPFYGIGPVYFTNASGIFSRISR